MIRTSLQIIIWLFLLVLVGSFEASVGLPVFFITIFLIAVRRKEPWLRLVLLTACSILIAVLYDIFLIESALILSTILIFTLQLKVIPQPLPRFFSASVVGAVLFALTAGTPLFTPRLISFAILSLLANLIWLNRTFRTESGLRLDIQWWQQ